MSPSTTSAWQLAVALGIGLLLGIDRERRKGEGPGRSAAGLRTFGLVALLGAVAAQTGQTEILFLAGSFVAVATVVAYLHSAPEDPGLTTEVALVLDFFLGALTVRDLQLAAGLGVVVTVVLSARSWLHTLVRRSLSEAEFHDALVFAAAALVVLPLMPDRGIGPYAALNLSVVWRLVVIVMTINGAGYLALRLFGPRFGLAASGLVSGFVSATATIGAMGARAESDARLLRSATAGAVLSTVATMIQMGLVVAVTSRELLQAMVWPLACGGLAAGLYGAEFIRRAAGEETRDGPELDLGSAFDLRTALILATTVSAVLVASAALLEWIGQGGLVLAAGVAGFADTHSAAMSAAALVAAGRIPAAEAVVPILAGLTTNSLAKLAMAVATGPRRYSVQVGAGLALVMAAVWLSWWVTGRG